MRKTNNLKKEIQNLKRLVFIQQKEIKNLQHFADRDFLTGLYNRKGFLDRAERFLTEIKTERFKRGAKRKIIFKSLTLFFIDLDNFRRINNLYGHKKGDKFLKLFGEILEKAVRPIDVVGRWGGDEFVILLLGANKQNSKKAAKRILNKLSSFQMENIKEMVGATIGVSVIEAKNCQRIKSIYELIEKADEAMYKGKNTNRKIVFY